MCSREDICDGYGFRFLNNVPAAELIAVGKESRHSSSYYWDNRKRTPAYLFQYTLSGSGTVRADGEEYLVEKGDAFFLRMPEEEAYYFDEKRNAAPWEFVYLMFGGSAVSGYYEYAVNHLGKILSVSEYHPAIQVLMELYSKAKNGRIRNAFSASSEVFRFLCLLCDTDNLGGSRPSSLVERAKRYLEQHYAKQITLAQVSESLGVSQSHLSREFSKYMGEQPIHYLTKIRLEQAVELLHSANMDLGEISRLCGFADSNYFGKVFKKHMKLSPNQFKKEIREQGYRSVKV